MFSLSLSFFFQSLFCFIYGWGSLPHDKKKFMFFLNDWKSLHFVFSFPCFSWSTAVPVKRSSSCKLASFVLDSGLFFFSFFHIFFLYPLLTLTSLYQYPYSPHSSLYISFGADKENLFNNHSFLGWQSFSLIFWS